MILYCVEMGRLESFPDYRCWYTEPMYAERLFSDQSTKILARESVDSFVRLVEVDVEVDLAPLTGTDLSAAKGLLCDLLNGYDGTMRKTVLKRTLIHDTQPAAV